MDNWKVSTRYTVSREYEGDKNAYSLELGIIKIRIEHTPEGYQVDILGVMGYTLKPRYPTLEAAKIAGIQQARRKLLAAFKQLGEIPHETLPR